MEAYVTDEQQLEAIRKWFKEHGKKILTVVLVLATIGLVGRYWFHHTEVVKIEASEEYTSMLMSQSQNDDQSSKIKAEAIIRDYSKTPYASLAGLFLAKLAIEQDNKDEALSHLQRVVAQGTVEEFSLVARVRAARIYISEKEYDKAFAMVSIEQTDGYSPLLEELKGDIYRAQDQMEKAKEAYEHALSLSIEKKLENPLLMLKVQELGGQVPEPKEDV